MSEEQIDWARFLPREPLATSDSAAIYAAGSGAVIASYSPDGEPSVYLMVDIGVRSDRLAGAYGWDSDHAVVIRRADGRWAEGFSAAGPIEAKAPLTLADLAKDPDALQKRRDAAPALPWRSCKERPPRVGDVYSLTEFSGSDRFRVTGRAGEASFDCESTRDPWKGHDDRNRWDDGHRYVWTPREPDVKAEPAPSTQYPANGSVVPFVPESTDAEKRRAQWRASWKAQRDTLGGTGPANVNVWDSRGHAAVYSSAKEEVGVPSGSPIERANAHLRPRWRSSPPYRSTGAGRDR